MPKKIISVLLALTLLITAVPTFTFPAMAAEPVGDIGNQNALDALGIDTSVMPEGYDANSLENPYGRSAVTLNPVYELFTTEMIAKPIVTTIVDTSIEDVVTESTTTISHPYEWRNTLYGNDKPLGKPIGEQGETIVKTVTLSSITTNITSPASIVTEPNFMEGFERLLTGTASASGNFLGTSEAAGLSGQVVTVGTGAMSKNGGLYLYFTDPVGGGTGSMKTLLDTNGVIGNTGAQMEEDFAASPYLMQNYLKITTGDYDKNGIDEVAVYVAEQGNSRVEVYKLETTSNPGEGFFLVESNWKLAWTYNFNETPYVSNMVSLVSGDINRDGTDDLAMTWGFYYGPAPAPYSPGRAVVLSGSNTKMLQVKKDIDLSHDTVSIIRAAFAFGDIDGDGVKDLILGGQLASDVAGGNINTRFVSIYTYEGTSDKYLQVNAKNFNLFEMKIGQYVNKEMSAHGNRFYSSPAMVANVATLNRDGMGSPTCIYLDSLLIENGDEGLVIKEALDQNVSFNSEATGAQREYLEYGAAAADFSGSAKQSLQLMQYHLPAVRTYHKYWDWWFHFTYIYDSYSVDYPGKLSMLRYTRNETAYVERVPNTQFSTSFCILNSDNDTSLLKYLGKHYIRYTDPKVLAVLSSPPYFKDLDQSSFSGSYKNSETSYSSSTGSGTSTEKSHTLNLGVYVSFQHEFTMPITGVKLGSFEAEASYTAGLTWATEHSSSLEQTISYSTLLGEDAVAFYSIPMEIYEFESMVPIINAGGEITGYDKQVLAVNTPHVASVKVLPLDTYEKIAADYHELPRIAGQILTHEVGNPATYPSTTFGYLNPIQYNGDWSGVNFGNGSISQEIAMSDESGKTFNQTHAIDIKVGAGPADFVFGRSIGYEFGSGKTRISTSGSSFTGTIYNMPAEAEPYGYGYAWKVFSYLGESNGCQFPVVDYLVTDVSAQPKLPDDFEQNSTGTTNRQIELNWSYKGSASGFQLYRYYQFPDGSGSYELAFVPASATYAVSEDGTRSFRYVDAGLDEYTDYDYQVQVIGTKLPSASILSEVYTARTKTGSGYPLLRLDGPVDGVLPVYPDTDSTVRVVVGNLSDYGQEPRYQWQKKTVDGWQDVIGAFLSTKIFRTAGLADEGEYRCRVNAIHNAQFITSYSDSFFLDYEKRTPMVVPGSFSVKDASGGASGTMPDKPTLSISLKSAHSNHYYIPTGILTFEIRGANYNERFPVELQAASGADEAIAVFTPQNELPTGVYEISAYYAGSRVYKSLSTVAPVHWFSGTGSGYLLTLDNSYTYGDITAPSLKKVEKAEGITTTQVISDNMTYRVMHDVWTLALHTTYNSLVYQLNPIEMDGFVSSSGAVTAAKAGSYRLIASCGGMEVAYSDFMVQKREITIGTKDQNSEAYLPTVTHPGIEVLSVQAGTLAPADTLADLGLFVKATDSGGKIVTISDRSDPGPIDIVGAPGTNARNMKYPNYDIKFIAGAFLLTGPKYYVYGTSLPVNGAEAGSLSILTPAGNLGFGERYPNGTMMVFYAKPLDGYSVKHWSILDTARNSASVPLAWIVNKDSHSQTLQHLMKSENIEVVAEYEVTQTRLWFPATTGGSITCTSSDVIHTGDVARVGADFTFKATPDTGYHFVEWQVTEVGKGLTKPAGTMLPDGSNTCTIKMGTGNTSLYAIFARNSYLITLNGSLQASYLYDNDKRIETPDVMKVVQTGTRIEGDKLVTVTHKPGYIVSDNAVWTKDGQTVTSTSGVSVNNQQFTFTMLADTVITTKTENERYNVWVTVTGAGMNVNTVTSKVNGLPAVMPANLSGGSALAFTANPAYGYVFDHWNLGDPALTAGGITLEIPALGAPLALEAVFRNNQSANVVLLHGLRGSFSYTINGGTPRTLYSPFTSSAFKVFKGDTVVITANPDPNFMVGYWRINGTIVQSTAKTQTFTDLIADADLTVEAVFAAQSYSTVSYSAGTGGSISATSDGVPFASGSNSVGNGSTLVFTSVPASDKMVSGWLMNDQFVLNAVGSPLVENVFTIPALAGSATVAVSFRDIVIHTLTTAVTHAAITSTFLPAWGGKPLDGATATLTLTPDDGYRLVTVAAIQTADGTPVAIDSTVKRVDGSWLCTFNAVTTDLTVLAEASRLFTLSIPSVPVGGSIILSTKSALPGETITLTGAPSTGYNFTNWVVSGGVTLGGASTPVTTFVMPMYDVNVAAIFTKSINGSNDNGNNGNGNAGAAPAPAPFEEFGPEAPVPGGAAVVFQLGTGRITPEDSVMLVEANKAQDLLLTGNGFSIRIPVGTLQTGDDLNDYVPDLTGLDLTVGDGWVVARTDASGIKHIIRWSIVPKGLVSFIAEGRGTYSVMDNSKLFDDTKGHWASRSIAFATARELFSGTGVRRFSTAAPMTRAMLVTVLHRLNGLTPSEAASFTDVPKGQWFSDAVAWAFTNKIVNGTGKGAFGANGNVTREQLVSILYRYAETLKLDSSFSVDLSAFSDARKVSPYALDAMMWAVENGIITGRSDKRIDPAGFANRAEVSSILERFIEYVLK